MAFAFTNVRLPGTAFLGDDWANIHAREFQETCSHLLIREEKPQCILLCGVGNAIDPITHEGRHGVEKVLELAFKETGAEEHGPPLCAWLSDNTMVAARPGGQIHPWQLAVADANFKAVPQEKATRLNMIHKANPAVEEIPKMKSASLAMLWPEAWPFFQNLGCSSNRNCASPVVHSGPL